MLNLLRHVRFHSVKAAESSPLLKLRRKTGIAYNLCREALNKHDNDVEQAEVWLRSQAFARITKIRTRSAREGLIGLAVDEGNKFASVLELCCETDFVAKNNIFKDYALQLTEKFATQHPKVNSTSQVPEEQLKEYDEELAPIIVKLGENIRVHRAFHLKIDDALLFGQIHSQAGRKSSGDFEIATGRFGALVGLKTDDSTKPLKLIGNRLCNHVIGFSPTFIELPKDLRLQLEKAEKEQENVVEEVASADDPIEDSEPVTRNTRDDWPSIMDQTLIMSDRLSVRDFCKANDVSLVYFKRFECGEEV